MKKTLLFSLLVLCLSLFVASCSKDDTNNNNNPNSSVQGRWIGNGQYGSGPGSPIYEFSLNFKADGTVDITGNNNAAIDIATGTWQIVADSLKATYRYISSSAIYRLSAKYSAGATVMTGTIGLDPSTTGTGVFTVTKE